MTADNEQPEAPKQRFTPQAAVQYAHAARRKSEFILSRCYGLFRDPKGEWKQIRDEDTTIPNILIGYVAPLAAIPIVCDLIGSTIFAHMLQAEPGQAVIRAVVTWIVSIALVGFLGVLINVVSTNFDAERNDLAAQKIAAYSLTPAFLSGVFSLFPWLWWVSLFALAAMVFLMYRGLPILMKAPEDRALGYAATVTIAAMVAGIVLFALSSCITTH
ncbi:MAG: Yip1 family protein [Vitreimonas sp.]